MFITELTPEQVDGLVHSDPIRREWHSNDLVNRFQIETLKWVMREYQPVANDPIFNQ